MTSTLRLTCDELKTVQVNWTTSQPGKLNLKEFSVVTDAIAKMNLGGKETTVSKLSKAGYGHAPLATPENVDLGSEYAQVKDAVANLYPPYDGEYSYTAVHDALASKTKIRHRREKGRPFHSDTPSDISDGSEADSSATTPRQKLHKRSLKLKKRPPGIAPPIPVPPELRSYSGQLSADNPESMFSSAKMKMEYGLLHDDDSSLDVSSPRDLNSPMSGGVLKPKDGDKTARRKEKQKAKADEKQEKRRLKEEKLKKLAEKEKEREKKKSKQKVGPVPHQPTLEDFVQSETNPIPLLLEKCVKFIEEEGLDSEGIYRVPGNRAHVDLLFQKFEEDPNLTIRDLDIPVNAVATALKDFFSKRLPPLLTQDMMAELEDISGARRVQKQGSTAYLNLEVITDRSCRLLHLRGLIKRLPTVNFEVLKFVFQHFVKVSENCKLNSMDSKNLAICWWPTLLPIEFSDMGRFEQMRPHLEDIVQTMIDQYPFLFCGKEAFVMV